MSSNNNNNNNNTMGAGNKASGDQASGNATGQAGGSQAGSNATGQGGVPSGNADGGRPQGGAGGRGRQGSSHASGSNQLPLGQGHQQALTIRPRGGGSGRGSLHSVQSGRIQKRMGTVKFASHDKDPKDIDPNYEVVKKAPKLETLEGRNVAIVHDKAIQASGDPDVIMPFAWALMATCGDGVQWDISIAPSKGYNIEESLRVNQARLTAGPEPKAQGRVVEEMDVDEDANLPKLQPGQKRCANCREVGHELEDCVRPSTQDWHKPKFHGGIRGCPSCNALHCIDTCAKFLALSAAERAYVLVERRQGKPQMWTRHCIYERGVLEVLERRTDIVPPLSILWVLANKETVAKAPYDYSLPKSTPFLKDDLASTMANVAWMKREVGYRFCILHPDLVHAMRNELNRAVARRAAAHAARLLKEEEALKEARIYLREQRMAQRAADAAEAAEQPAGTEGTEGDIGIAQMEDQNADTGMDIDSAPPVDAAANAGASSAASAAPTPKAKTLGSGTSGKREPAKRSGRGSL
ncbi:hypothetical protein PoMZ_10814 [Pyricularia oryzae]|uniref:Uncharacterized protein n=1 Tax=Pyricularia oryzae TaxID=318829 RepID=A0A4P7MYH8_PYROR|nr:hypothetical protein PoMZ_10814 [Pyricularia oryzae]